MTFLEKILDSKRDSLNDFPSLSELRNQAEQLDRQDLRQPNWGQNLDVIAEIKRRSPSKGELASVVNPEDLARTYENAGAVIISVLTDEQYFGAMPDDFSRVRESVQIPVLRKDFIIDERQVYETYLMNADVMLLIVAAIADQNELKNLYDLARSLGLSVIVETHNEEELDRARTLEAEIIGINVRDLATFDENLSLGDDLVSRVGPNAKAVWESSIAGIDDALRARKAGADAVLVGQALVQNENPGEFIKQIRNIS